MRIFFNKLRSHGLFWPGLAASVAVLLVFFIYSVSIRGLPEKLVQAALRDYQLHVSFDQLDVDVLSTSPRLHFYGLDASYADDSPIVDSADFTVYIDPRNYLSGDFYIKRLESSVSSIDVSAFLRWQDTQSDVIDETTVPNNKAAHKQKPGGILAIPSISLGGISMGYFHNDLEVVLKGELQSTLDNESLSRITEVQGSGEMNGLPSEVGFHLLSINRQSLAAKINTFNVGESDLGGSLLFERGSDGVNVTGALSSNLLQLGEVSGSDQRLRQGAANARRQSGSTIASAEGEEQGDNGKVFSSDNLGLVRFNQRFSGLVEYKIKEARFRNLYTNDLQLTVTGQAKESQQVVFNADNFGGGNLRTELELTLANELPSLDFNTTIEQVKVQELLSLAGDSDTVKGTFSGKANYHSTGLSASELAGNVHGELVLLAESGQLDAMLVEVAGIDIAEAITLLLKNDMKNTKINCAFIIANTEAGNTTIDDLLIDTSDTVFLGEGYLNLKTERMNVLIKPYPRDISFFAAPTAIRISGAIDSPSIKPAKTLFARLAAAAALAATVTPVAAILPFMSLGSDANEAGCNDLIH